MIYVNIYSFNNDSVFVKGYKTRRGAIKKIEEELVLDESYSLEDEDHTWTREERMNMAFKLIGDKHYAIVDTRISQYRFEVVASPNTNSLFVYDNYRDVYIDVPVCEDPDNLDDEHIIELEDKCNVEHPEWLDDEAYFYDDIC